MPDYLVLRTLIGLAILFLVSGCSTLGIGTLAESNEALGAVYKNKAVLESIDTASAPLHPYPIGNDSLAEYSVEEYAFDKNGVIMPRDGRKWNNAVYHPTSIARYAMAQYYAWYSGGGKGKRHIANALEQTNYLVKQLNCEPGDFALLRYPYPGSFGLAPGWGSAMGQGLAISAIMLLKPFSDRPEAYEQAIECAVRSYTIDVFDGGVKTRLSSDANWYEEYPAVRRPMVLNGHIFALSGLWYAADQGNETARILFNKGVTAVKRNLHFYDTGFISRYANTSEPHYLSPDRYNPVHIDQLLWLWHVTGDLIFWNYAKKWLAYQDGRVKKMIVVNGNGEMEPAGEIDDANTYYGREGYGDLPIHVIAELPRVAEVTRIVVFGYGYTGNFGGIRLYSEGKNGRTLLHLTERRDLRVQHKTGRYETTILVFDVDDHRPTSRYRVVFANPNVAKNSRLVLREVDFHFDQSVEGYARYKELARINYWPGDLRPMPPQGIVDSEIKSDNSVSS